MNQEKKDILRIMRFYLLIIIVGTFVLLVIFFMNRREGWPIWIKGYIEIVTLGIGAIGFFLQQLIQIVTKISAFYQDENTGNTEDDYIDRGFKELGNNILPLFYYPGAIAMILYLLFDNYLYFFLIIAAISIIIASVLFVGFTSGTTNNRDHNNTTTIWRSVKYKLFIVIGVGILGIIGGIIFRITGQQKQTNEQANINIAPCRSYEEMGQEIEKQIKKCADQDPNIKLQYSGSRDPSQYSGFIYNNTECRKDIIESTLEMNQKCIKDAISGDIKEIEEILKNLSSEKKELIESLSSQKGKLSKEKKNIDKLQKILKNLKMD